MVDVLVNVVIGGDGSVALAWQPGTDPGTTGWNVYRADEDGPYVKMNGTPIPNDYRCAYRRAGQWPRPSLPA